MKIPAKSPRTAYDLDPVSLFLTDERSDAAVVGSGNKAMGKSSLLTFRSWDNLKLQDLGL